jgi:hypothetical protein
MRVRRRGGIGSGVPFPPSHPPETPLGTHWFPDKRRLHASPVAGIAHMPDVDRLSKLRHDLANPLSALLAEAQLLLLNESQLDPATVTGLREIESLAIRMRTILRETSPH